MHFGSLKKPVGFSIYYKLVTPDLIAEIKREMRFSKGLQLWAWTVNDPQIAKDLAKFGVTGIICDDYKKIGRRFKK